MKFVCLAAAAAATLFALPAAAADLRVSRNPSPVVRIAIAGKTDAQMTSEIKAAAATVCGADAGSCVQTATREATRHRGDPADDLPDRQAKPGFRRPVG